MRPLFLALAVAAGFHLPKFEMPKWPGSTPPAPGAGRLVLFVGVDISGSFLRGGYFDDSIRFLARYLYGHLNGLGGMEVPHTLFVGSIGGDKKDEAKTLFPIQTFEDLSIEQIEAKLREIFPRNRENQFTDYNSFFDQVADMVETRKLILKPLSIVLFTDGVPDVGGSTKAEKFRNLKLKPLESLSRNITLRVLYTDAVTARSWRDEVPRKRVKVWTQDAIVMRDWKNPKTMLAGKPFSEQQKFFAWLQDNVDFQPRLRPVN